MSALRRSTYFGVLAVLLAILALVHFTLWPKVLEKMKELSDISGNLIGDRVCLLIQETLLAKWRPHSLQLMAWDNQSTGKPFDATLITESDTLPAVLSTFYLNFKERRAYVSNPLVPADTILNTFTYRNKSGGGAHLMPNMTGGGSEFERRLVGGAIKFLNITYSGTKYPVLIRYLHSDYPSRAVDAVGFILDREWFTQRVHNVLDSLAKENSQILLMAPPPTDTKENEIYPLEPFSSILGTQTIGVKMGVDTLWWWGDPQVKIRYPYEYPYYPLTAFDMTVGARVKNSWDVVYVWTFRTWTVVLILLELVGCGLLVTLFIGGVSARRQVRRNQIALAHLAHAIKTPIARIRLNVDSLTKEMVASPEEEQGIIAAIDNECQRLERSIHGAAMSLEAGKRTVFPTDGDLRPLIEGVIEGWRPSFANAGVKLLLTADAAVPAKFDPEQIRIVCDNLLDNALRHARLNIGNVPESKVTVSLRTVAGGAEIAVDDTGSGIPKSERKRIFQRFQRVTGSAGTGTSGLGLGLALVKEIVAAHGGSVGIEESKLGGARFVVRLS